MLELKKDIEVKIKERVEYLKNGRSTVDSFERALGGLEAYIDVVEMIKEREETV